MSTSDLYEPCTLCGGTGVRDNRLCFGCRGERFVKIGLTAGQLERLHDESRRWYRADGSFEVLDTSSEVVERRKAAARELADARAALETVVCSFCGHSIKRDASVQENMATHILECEKHPLRAAALELAELRDALRESVTLQSRYAELLNGWDGGLRRSFATADDWVQRLRECRASTRG